MAEREETSEIEKRLTTYAKYGVVPAFLLAAAIAGVRVGAPAFVLVLAAGALLGVIASFWSSLRTLFGETPLSGADAYAIGAPRAEEEQKRAVIRAINDLKFELSIGKISQQDFDALNGRYRAEAKRLLRVLDEESAPRREAVEALVARRLRKEGLLDEASSVEADAEAVKEAAPVKTKKKKKSPGERAARKAKATPIVKPEEAASEARACDECGTMNDADAVFCKKCGARQAAEATEEASEIKPTNESNGEA